MLKPSYAELMDIMNKDSQEHVTSRYTIVIAAAKRARQIIDGDEPMIEDPMENKPVSTAVEEIREGKIKIVPEGQGTVLKPVVKEKDKDKEKDKEEIKKELNENIAVEEAEEDSEDIDIDIDIVEEGVEEETEAEGASENDIVEDDVVEIVDDDLEEIISEE